MRARFTGPGRRLLLACFVLSLVVNTSVICVLGHRNLLSSGRAAHPDGMQSARISVGKYVVPRAGGAETGERSAAQGRSAGPRRPRGARRGAGSEFGAAHAPAGQEKPTSRVPLSPLPGRVEMPADRQLLGGLLSAWPWSEGGLFGPGMLMARRPLGIPWRVDYANAAGPAGLGTSSGLLGPGMADGRLGPGVAGGRLGSGVAGGQSGVAGGQSGAVGGQFGTPGGQSGTPVGQSGSGLAGGGARAGLGPVASAAPVSGLDTLLAQILNGALAGGPPGAGPGGPDGGAPGAGNGDTPGAGTGEGGPEGAGGAGDEGTPGAGPGEGGPEGTGGVGEEGAPGTGNDGKEGAGGPEGAGTPGAGTGGPRRGAGGSGRPGAGRGRGGAGGVAGRGGAGGSGAGPGGGPAGAGAGGPGGAGGSGAGGGAMGAGGTGVGAGGAGGAAGGAAGGSGSGAGYGTEVVLPAAAGETGTGESFIPETNDAMNPVLAPLTIPGLPPFTPTSKVGHPGFIKTDRPQEMAEPEPDPVAELQEPPRKEPPPKPAARKPRPHKPRPAHKPKPPKPIVIGSLSLRGNLMMDPPPAKPKPKPKPKLQPKKKLPPKPKAKAPKKPKEEDLDLDLDYREEERFADLAGDGTGLLAQYFEGRNFERPLFRRADHNVEFDWRNRLPDARMPRAAYSVRWTGKIVPRYSEVYNFYLASDDGSRLWVNGQKLIDCWQIQSISENKGSIRLEAGKAYDLRVEFFEKIGDSTALCFLYWESPSQKREFVPESALRFPEFSALR